jgi:hypothetical protein
MHVEEVRVTAWGSGYIDSFNHAFRKILFETSGI